MGVQERWSAIAAEVLEEQSAVAARSRLAEALLRTTGVVQAARVRVHADGRASWFVTGDGAPETVDHLPPGGPVNRHPFHRFHTATGRHDPMLLPDVVRDGWTASRETMEIIERLGLTMNQLSLPLERSRHGGYDGWVLVSPEPVDATAVPRLTAVQSLVRGLDRHVRLLGQLSPPAPAGSLLTPRETVVLSLLAAGRTAEAIAARLGISPRTVHKHQEHLYRKLGAVDRLSAVLRGQELGLLSRRQPEPD